MIRIKSALARMAAVAVAGSAVLATAPAHAATTPPWEPDSGSVGGLSFFDASGHQITGGSITSQPIAAYVQGTTTIRSGDTKATLYGFLPKSGQAPAQWSGEVIGGPSSYPNSSAPAALASSSLPLYTGSASDLSVANLQTDYPNTDTSSDGYAGIYQLRLVTTVAGQPGNTTYDSADIAINGNTWSVVYSKGSESANTQSVVLKTFSNKKIGGGQGQVVVHATVTPANSANYVTFYRRSGLSGKVVPQGNATPVNGVASRTITAKDGTIQDLYAVVRPNAGFKVLYSHDISYKVA